YTRCHCLLPRVFAASPAWETHRWLTRIRNPLDLLRRAPRRPRSESQKSTDAPRWSGKPATAISCWMTGCARSAGSQKDDTSRLARACDLVRQMCANGEALATEIER